MTKVPSFHKPLWFALLVLSGVMVVELLCILHLNDGHFTFTLDDAYIHLALAMNINNGHYGINSNEFSSPSSSIVWPFLLSHIARFRIAPYLVLLLNFVMALGTIVLYWRILTPDRFDPMDKRDYRQKSIMLAVLLVLMILVTNVVGLAYLGMEHSLQLLMSVLIVFGMIQEIRGFGVSIWFLFAIVFAPLVRYECLALSAPAILFLAVRGYWAKSAATATILALLLAAFSLFLESLGLKWLPASVYGKSLVAFTGGSFDALVGNLKTSLQMRQGLGLVLVMLLLLYYGMNGNHKKENRLLAWLVAFSVFLHLLFGRYNWYNRYEIYIWTASLLSLCYVYKEWVYGQLSAFGYYKSVAFAVVSGVLVGANYVFGVASIPQAANNIYQQQYQMHRFALIYNKPVAVNDIGYVSYRNPNYVLDLVGLASFKVLDLRMSNTNDAWMGQFVRGKDIKLIMIYDQFFRGIPASWKKLGDLLLGGEPVTAQYEKVSFYAVDCNAYRNINGLLEGFVKTLPAGVRFDFSSGVCASPQVGDIH